MTTPLLTAEAYTSLSQTYQDKTAQEILQKAVELIPNLGLACSFGAEDMVLLDMLMDIDKSAKVFYLDTDVLFDDTYELIERALKKYGIPNLIRVSPNITLEEQAKEHGEALWNQNPDLCCSLRKVEPLTRILGTFDGWITGIRRDQAPTRANAQAFENDTKFGLSKVNPLIQWTSEDVWEYIRVNDVPYNPMHDNGYPSIGCIHCTLPVAPGADPRSGRWAGQAKTECGLHK